MAKKPNIDNGWKEKNKKYLKELQMFFDLTDNIEDESLKRTIIYQMLRCDEILTELANQNFINYYEMGYKEAKNE